ncbi:MAG: hypothetical protein FWF92_08300 [Oscillospiraceae bacterium]|nr:hypothetical protein [Oscillospiraceae bacterium]
MIYQHQQKAIDYITDKFYSDNQVDALLISGSVSHGFNDENSDIDINIVVSDEIYAQKNKEYNLTYWENAENFYPGGYFDGKFITLNYLELVAERGNEPTRFALHDSKIAFDKTNRVAGYIKKIGEYKSEDIKEKTIRFLSQLEAWKWYCDEALKKSNQYLLDLSVSKLILFAGRLILLENKLFFPYHKWFMKVLENAGNKPPEFIRETQKLLEDKSPDNIARFYDLVKNYKDWANGENYSWSSNFVVDTETVWMRQNEFIENI